MLTIGFCVGATLTSCSLSGIAGPNDFRRLGHAKAKWDARPFADYEFEIRQSCFCPPEITQWVRVSVRDGAVAAAEAIEPNPNFPISSLRSWQPIDSLFSRLFRFMAEGEGAFETIIVDYDPELGFPARIEFHARSDVLDAGGAFSVRNVRPLN